MEAIFIAVFSVTSIGIVCAAVLCVASKFMFVEIDERVTQVLELLPGANCGACGYGGCSAYAEALLSGKDVKANLCTPGGSGVISRISAFLGVKAESVEKRFAVVHCQGHNGVQRKKMDYSGIKSCEAAKQLFGGEGACAFGCLGYGDCGIVCPSGAICLENGLAWIDPKLCTGCGLCVKSCPNSLITVEDAGIAVSVLCRNPEKGAVTRKKCSKGCIACGKCVRTCLSGAITVENNFAVIDHSKCTSCGNCVKECVTHSIQGHS